MLLAMLIWVSAASVWGESRFPSIHRDHANQHTDAGGRDSTKTWTNKELTDDFDVAFDILKWHRTFKSHIENMDWDGVVLDLVVAQGQLETQERVDKYVISIMQFFIQRFLRGDWETIWREQLGIDGRIDLESRLRYIGEHVSVYLAPHPLQFDSDMWRTQAVAKIENSEWAQQAAHFEKLLLAQNGSKHGFEEIVQQVKRTLFALTASQTFTSNDAENIFLEFFGASPPGNRILEVADSLLSHFNRDDPSDRNTFDVDEWNEAIVDAAEKWDWLGVILTLDKLPTRLKSTVDKVLADQLGETIEEFQDSILFRGWVNLECQNQPLFWIEMESEVRACADIVVKSYEFEAIRTRPKKKIMLPQVRRSAAGKFDPSRWLRDFKDNVANQKWDRMSSNIFEAEKNMKKGEYQSFESMIDKILVKLELVDFDTNSFVRFVEIYAMVYFSSNATEFDPATWRREFTTLFDKRDWIEQAGHFQKLLVSRKDKKYAFSAMVQHLETAFIELVDTGNDLDPNVAEILGRHGSGNPRRPRDRIVEVADALSQHAIRYDQQNVVPFDIVSWYDTIDDMLQSWDWLGVALMLDELPADVKSGWSEFAKFEGFPNWESVEAFQKILLFKSWQHHPDCESQPSLCRRIEEIARRCMGASTLLAVRYLELNESNPEYSKVVNAATSALPAHIQGSLLQKLSNQLSSQRGTKRNSEEKKEQVGEKLSPKRDKMEKKMKHTSKRKRKSNNDKSPRKQVTAAKFDPSEWRRTFNASIADREWEQVASNLAEVREKFNSGEERGFIALLDMMIDSLKISSEENDPITQDEISGLVEVLHDLGEYAEKYKYPSDAVPSMVESDPETDSTIFQRMGGKRPPMDRIAQVAGVLSIHSARQELHEKDSVPFDLAKWFDEVDQMIQSWDWLGVALMFDELPSDLKKALDAYTGQFWGGNIDSFQDILISSCISSPECEDDPSFCAPRMESFTRDTVASYLTAALELLNVSDSDSKYAKVARASYSPISNSRDYSEYAQSQDPSIAQGRGNDNNGEEKNYEDHHGTAENSTGEETESDGSGGLWGVFIAVAAAAASWSLYRAQAADARAQRTESAVRELLEEEEDSSRQARASTQKKKMKKRARQREERSHATAEPPPSVALPSESTETGAAAASETTTTTTTTSSSSSTPTPTATLNQEAGLGRSRLSATESAESTDEQEKSASSSKPFSNRTKGEPTQECAFCFSPARRACSGCSQRFYCGTDCQRAHWRRGHKEECATRKHESSQALAEAANPDDRVAAPREFLCPISRDIMEEPVVAADNQTYERDSIELWIVQVLERLDEAEQGLRNCDEEARKAFEKVIATGIKSPTTGTALAHVDLVPNDTLREEIRAFRRLRSRSQFF